MKLINIVLISVATVMFGCWEANNHLSDDYITIHVNRDYPEKELILQDFMDVEYLPLETTDEFITNGYVQAIGKDILIVRNGNMNGDIFFFDRETGKGLRKINRRGQGYEEYIAIFGLIALDENNGEMFVHDPAVMNILVYDLFGNFKRRIKYKSKDDSSIFGIRYDPIYNLDEDHLICHDYSNGRNFNRDSVHVKQNNIFHIISKEDGSITREIIIPYEKKLSQVSRSDQGIGTVYNSGLIPYRDNWILTEPSADTIYTYSPGHHLKPFIVRYPSVQSMEPEVFLFLGVITEEYIFMQSIKKEYDVLIRGLPIKNLVYDRKKMETFEYAVYNDDFAYKRPIENLVFVRNELTVINNNEIAFMEKIEAFELVEAYHEGKLKGRLKEIAATLNEESNPVIMIAKHKK